MCMCTRTHRSLGLRCRSFGELLLFSNFKCTASPLAFILNWRSRFLTATVHPIPWRWRRKGSAQTTLCLCLQGPVLNPSATVTTRASSKVLLGSWGRSGCVHSVRRAQPHLQGLGSIPEIAGHWAGLLGPHTLFSSLSFQFAIAVVQVAGTLRSLCCLSISMWSHFLALAHWEGGFSPGATTRSA